MVLKHNFTRDFPRPRPKLHMDSRRSVDKSDEYSMRPWRKGKFS